MEAARLRGMVDYPVGLKTRVPGVPGAHYHEPWPTDSNQAPYALLGHKTVTISDIDGSSDVNGDHVRIQFRLRSHERRVDLDLSQIEDVFVDCRRGYAMPLHGSLVLPIGLTRHKGISVLRWPSGIIEQDTHDRAEVMANCDYPGITVANFYNADAIDSKMALVGD
jgi:hypothetical protein